MDLEKDTNNLAADVAEMLREAQEQKARQSKAGRCCPHCGATVDVFDTYCPSCGHELRNNQASGAVNKLADQLLKAEQQESSPERQHSVKMSVLRSFKVPTGHEDLMELLTLAIPHCKDKGFLPHLMVTPTIRFFSHLLALSLAILLFALFFGLITGDDIIKNIKYDLIFVLCAMIFTVPLSLLYAKFGLPKKYVWHNEEAVIWRQLAKEAIARLRPQATTQQEREKIDEMEKQIK